MKQQLEETSEIRSDVEQLDQEIKEAQTLCDELSVLIGEQYLKDELKKRLETASAQKCHDQYNKTAQNVKFPARGNKFSCLCVNCCRVIK